MNQPVRQGVRTVCVLVAMFAASVAHSATIVVPADGDLQAALNAAQSGDVIALEAGATYVGNFVLPNKGDITLPIVIRSSASDASLPAPGIRMTPAYAALLPKIKSPNGLAALSTAPAANHWTLQFLEFQANANGTGDIIDLGAGDSTQTDLSQVPYQLLVDRVYVHGDPIMGQKRGIGLNSRDTTIVNSYIVDCKSVTQDSQAISGFNGPGNYLIENNYLEAAAEDFLLGGADPPIPNLVTSNVTFRRNHLSKPLAWRDPIVADVTNVAAAAAAGAGSLAAGTYSYKVAARMPAGLTTAVSAPSAEAGATLDAAGGISISWTPVAGAIDYRVYGRLAGSQNMFWTTTDPVFTDTGAAGTNGTPARATKWSVKNLFELKNAQDVIVEGNVMENLWVADQSGYPILFTPRNQNGRAPWAVVQRVRFEHNLVRHAAGGINILGRDNINPSQLTNLITIRDNVFDDLTSAWGPGARPFQLGNGPDSITIDHNTIITNDPQIYWMYGGPASSPTPITNAVYTNNMSAHNTYGMIGSSFASGFSSINAYLPGSVIDRNVLAGGKAALYPGGNYFPTVDNWRAEFVDYSGGDYHLLPTSVFRTVATDGGDLGANIDLINDEAAKALSGDNSAAASAPVRIVTASLPDGTVNQPYNQALQCTGGSAPCAWQITDGLLPEGFSFDKASGSISGTTSTVETTSLTFAAYDPKWPTNNASATFTLTINPVPLAVTVPPPPEGRVGAPYELTLLVAGEVGTVNWSLTSGSLPPGLALDPASGVIAGVPTVYGTFGATVQALDSWGTDRTDAKSVTISIAPVAIAITSSSLPSGRIRTFYRTALRVSGGTGATNWTLVSGALPRGLTLVGASGVISGTPSLAGSFTFSIQAADKGWPGNVNVRQFTIRISPRSRKG